MAEPPAPHIKQHDATTTMNTATTAAVSSSNSNNDVVVAVPVTRNTSMSMTDVMNTEESNDDVVGPLRNDIIMKSNNNNSNNTTDENMDVSLSTIVMGGGSQQQHSSSLQQQSQSLQRGIVVNNNNTNNNNTLPTATLPIPPPPYVWDKSSSSTQLLPSPEIIQLWNEVGNGIDRSQTVVWKSAVESFDYAFKYFSTCEEGRYFVERYAGAVVGILAEQSPTKIGPMERNCVQETLRFAVLIVAADLNIQLNRGNNTNDTKTTNHQIVVGDSTGTPTSMPVPTICGECLLLDSVLSHLFSRKKAFYKGLKNNTQNNNNNNQSNWQQQNHNNMNNNNNVDIRIRNIEKFRGCHGFNLLHTYLLARLPYCKVPNTTATVSSATTTTTGNAPQNASIATVSSNGFPSLETLHHILSALFDTLPINPASTIPNAAITNNNNNNLNPNDPHNNNLIQQQKMQQLHLQQEMDAIKISRVVMLYLQQLQNDDIKKLPTDILAMTFKALQKIFDRLVVTRRDECVHFYQFYRSIILTMISSTSLPLKLSGWEQLNELIKACYDHRPPPRSFIVRDAGCTIVNGIYHFAGTVTPDGYAKPGADVSYVRAVPMDAAEGAGKKFTLFRCTMRSQQKWWFLSEADEEQPGTDRDIDYYQHKSKEHEEAYPPPGGWITCRSAGIHPPPTLEPIGYMVPTGYEMDTLEHQLAKWAIENEIVEQVLGDTTIHREVVARSTVLIKFLASMCTRDDRVVELNHSSNNNNSTNTDILSSKRRQQQPNMFCLQTSHLLFAWKTCTRKADAAVSLQVYQLLVSILPLCPSQLAIPLLQAIQTSLRESSEKRDYLFEVSEFCSALAALNLVEVNTKNQAAAVPGTALTEDVREEVLNLLWSVLTHPGVSALKTYDSLKRYVTRELKVEPKGSELRERFLQSCFRVLSENSEKVSGSMTDEVQALRMVKLTLFILEACPRTQANAIVSANNGALPMLLFKEVVAYLQRRRDKAMVRPKHVSRRPSLTNVSIGTTASFNSTTGTTTDVIEKLEDRLRILRHVYGLSEPSPGIPDPISMNAAMINTLWELGSYNSTERELLMMFIASASHPGKPTQYDRVGNVTSTVSNNPNLNSPGGTIAEPLLSAAFSEDVCHSVFLNLFCAPSFDYDQLGTDGYWSFQFLFKAMRNSPNASLPSKRMALDALWRLCLTVGNNSVASQAMHDLLGVYVGILARNRDLFNQQQHTEADDDFGERIFECLEKVKIDLESNMPSVERSIERCMRILNAAIGQGEADGFSTIPTLARLSAIAGTNFTLDDATRCLPHGMRAQSCCRRIGVMAKRSQNHNNGGNNYDNTPPKNQPTVKFSLDVHPLETLATVKYKVALHCQCTVQAVKPIQITGRARISSIDPAHMNLSVVPEDTVMDELGVLPGCEIVFIITERALQANGPVPPPTTQRSPFSNDLSVVFFSRDGKFVDRLFSMVLEILEIFYSKDPSDAMRDDNSVSQSADIHKLVWDLLHAMPTNETVSARVKSINARNGDPSSISTSESMEVDNFGESWSELLDIRNFDRSVYVLKTIDAFLQPAPEAFSIFPSDKRIALEKKMIDDANSFRRTFIDADGFGAVVRFFSMSGKSKDAKTRQGNAVALRILKSCLFGNTKDSQETMDPASIPDNAGFQLLNSLTDTTGLLNSLTAMVVEDSGISSSTISDVLRFLRLLFHSPAAAQRFVELPDAKTFLSILLMWDESPVSGRISLSVNAALQIRKSTHDLILQTPALADKSLPWLIHSIEAVAVESESTSEYFDVLEKLISGSNVVLVNNAISTELRNLANIVCKKLALVPRPGGETDLNDVSTGVLCGCLKILRALVEFVGGNVLKNGVGVLLAALGTKRWSELMKPPSRGVLSIVSTSFTNVKLVDDAVLIDLMGVIFDGFLSPGGTSSIAICCDKDSRGRAFDVVATAARKCSSPDSYLAISRRIEDLVASAAPKLRHRWGQFGSNNEPNARNRVSKYAGLRNQGCTCYMNSVLQQLFMMPELRRTLCAAKLPSKLRSVGSKVATKGASLVGKKVSLQWDSGGSFDAIVESFDSATDMHTIRYCPIELAVGNNGRQQIPVDVSRLPPNLPDEFVLSEGRPGKETGVFDIVPDTNDMDASETKHSGSINDSDCNETEDEAMSRHLLEEVQRTFIHLEEGSRGQCFDPRALVEACAFLKLEFDVWQQNDASEFATKLLDRLEISLKKWAPETFHSMDHTFGVKQTKQKTCKKCGLKTNREEKLLTIDCQIRGKGDIQEALSAMTEVEIMEGSNQVYCDRCKENTDTILKSAISTFPNMLILSLKRFDLDYNTFETVKLNSRCAFGQTLNMKKYSIDALELLESNEQNAAHDTGNDPNSMDSDSIQHVDGDDPLGALPDDKYEYRLAGVLVHAGVAQGGHYYSFIKDRLSGADEKWYRFDDDDVTPFDPNLIETECFGGKIKKETKWPNGQVHTVEQEQFANALMVFYEKVMPNDIPPIEANTNSVPQGLSDQSILSGYDVFEPDVNRSNEIHRWQSFLFDVEFRGFLKSLLRLCHNPKRDTTDESDVSWRAPMIHMLISFLFDVMMYSSDYSGLNDWAATLADILNNDCEIATTLLRNLASRSNQVSSNWLRTYIMDCPDHSIRNAALRIFMAAINSGCNAEDEKKFLTNWIKAWRDQIHELHAAAGDGHFRVPCTLEGKYKVCEDPRKIGSGASSVGMILSFTCCMIEAVPRYWRFSTELCNFIRFLAMINIDNGEALLRRSMIDSQIPARIISLIVRDKTPSYLKIAFPGACVSLDVATTQMRPESNPNPHMMHMSGSSMLNASDLNNPRGPGHTEHVILLEALACLAGIKGINHSPLVIRETDPVVRTRQWISLTDDAVNALSIIFHESCAPGAPGMGQREIEIYLHRSGVDTGGVSTQKIQDMLSKYPTTKGTENDRGTYLSLDGFQAYYRDCVQSNDSKLRLDLHAFGFRPDLTRRSRECRYFKIGDRESQCLPPQSVALDIAEMFKDKPSQMGLFADYGLAHTPPLYAVANETNSPLMEYIVAAAAYRKNTNSLIDRTLVALYQAGNNWEGNNMVDAGTGMLEVIAATPGDDQQSRIHRIMMSNVKAQSTMEFGSGILIVLRALHMRHVQHWSFRRYLDLLKKLYNLYPIFKWMTDNRNLWSFVEREFESARMSRGNVGVVVHNQNHIRPDYVPREAEKGLSSLEQQTNSDSEVGMQDSDDEDDSNFDNADVGSTTNGDNNNYCPSHIVVEGAGNVAVNGIYVQDGIFEGAIQYSRDGTWNNRRYRFLIILCNVSNNTKHWYISIIPNGSSPGTSSDIDFYTAPITETSLSIPPKTGWIKTGEGKDPPPHIVYHDQPIIVDNMNTINHNIGSNNNIMNNNGNDGVGGTTNGGNGTTTTTTTTIVEDDDIDENPSSYL